MQGGANMKPDTHRRQSTARSARGGRKTAPVRKPSPASAPVLTASELRRAVYELANTLAPADVGDLLAEEEALRERARLLTGEPGKLLALQVDLAIACLRDHDAGECPQIPYYTISLLAAGLAYLGDELDLVPDFLPHIGTLDDALVMAMACRLADEGLRRYCTWKEIDPRPALGAERTARRRRALP
jgi:uncharacterized membrane protein YkvA (DUF1232 family)